MTENTSFLAQRAMLGMLNIKHWSARKLDKRATDDVLARNNAASDAGRFTKSLVPKSSIEAIGRYATQARTLHYERTLPWQDGGWRILPASAYQAYCNDMRPIREGWEKEVDAFVKAYPSLIKQSQKSLAGLYDESDYPAKNEIRGFFVFDNKFIPVPQADDFRADLAESQVAEIRQSIERDTQEALNGAIANVWERVADTVGNMAGKLAAYQPANGEDKATGIFRDSLVGNVRELVEVLPNFNLNNDPRLDAVVERMRNELCQFDADQLREDEDARKDVASKAAAIFDQVSTYIQ